MKENPKEINWNLFLAISFDLQKMFQEYDVLRCSNKKWAILECSLGLEDFHGKQNMPILLSCQLTGPFRDVKIWRYLHSFKKVFLFTFGISIEGKLVVDISCIIFADW